MKSLPDNNFGADVVPTRYSDSRSGAERGVPTPDQRPTVQSDHQTDAEHSVGGELKTVNDGDITKTPRPQFTSHLDFAQAVAKILIDRGVINDVPLAAPELLLAITTLCGDKTDNDHD